MDSDIDFDQLYAALSVSATYPLLYREVMWAKVVYDEPPTKGGAIGTVYGVSILEQVDDG